MLVGKLIAVWLPFQIAQTYFWAWKGPKPSIDNLYTRPVLVPYSYFWYVGRDGTTRPKKATITDMNVKFTGTLRVKTPCESYETNSLKLVEI